MDAAVDVPLRVLLVVEASFAGVGRHVLDLAAGLAARGVAVDVLYGAERAEPGFVDRLSRTAVRNVGTFRGGRAVRPRDVSAITAVRRFSRAHGPYDVVHGHASKAGAYVRLAPGLRPARVVYTPNAFVTQSPDLSTGARRVYGTVERWLARRTDALVLVSPEEAAHADALPLRPRSSAVIPNGIPLVPLPSRAAARSALGLAPDGEIVGFVGRLSAQKSVDMLVRAFVDVVAARPEARLAIIGEGEEGEALRGLVRALGLDDAVVWCGRRDGQEAMPAFDVLALPSRYEGFPYVVLEALWAGTPVVATEGCNTSLVLADERCGSIVPWASAPIAAALVERLAGEAGGGDDEAARREAASRHSVEAMVDTTLALYRARVARG